MSGELERPPDDLWLVKHGGQTTPCTPADALTLLAQLAYEGALPGTHAEVWWWTGDGWERADQPYNEPDMAEAVSA